MAPRAPYLRALLLCAALALGACSPTPEPAKPLAPDVARLAEDLRAYDRDIMSVLEVKSTAKLGATEEAALKRGSTLNPSATQDDIRALERRMGRKLPPSLREYLQTSNGMLFHGATNIVTMRPASQIEPLTADNYPSLDSWLTLADVGVQVESSAGGPLPGPALAHAWLLSNVEDGDVYLVLPELQRPDGEWPVWFFGSKNPGAIAYHSFAQMFEREKGRGVEELKDR